MIRYQTETDGVTPDQLAGFFVGWPDHPDPATHLKILRNSACVCLAFDGNHCVGFINALSDGVFYAFVPLLEVLPEYQGRGIGKELLNRMIGLLRDMYAIDLVCDTIVAPFYRKLGFGHVAGMVRRNVENQGAKRHRAAG